MTVDVACNYTYACDAPVCQCRLCCGGCVAMLHEGWSVWASVFANWDTNCSLLNYNCRCVLTHSVNSFRTIATHMQYVYHRMQLIAVATASRVSKLKNTISPTGCSNCHIYDSYYSVAYNEMHICISLYATLHHTALPSAFRCPTLRCSISSENMQGAVVRKTTKTDQLWIQ